MGEAKISTTTNLFSAT